MGHEQHGRIVRASAPVDELGHPLLIRRIEAQQRFVTQQHLRVAHQCLGDAQPLLFSARQRVQRCVRIALGADLRHGVGDAAPPLGAAAPSHTPAMTVHAQADQVDAAQRHPVLDPLLLRNVADL